MFSELWESPTPSESELKAQFSKVKMSDTLTYTQIPKYCVYSNEKSPVCNKLKLGDYRWNGIIYERDEYWNKAAKIPEQASVLIMRSEIDPNSPSKYAEYLLEALDGDKKELITFKYSLESNIVNDINQELCGMPVLASFVRNEGDLTKLNKTCVEEDMSSAFNWTLPDGFQKAFFSTDDVYDGVYDPRLSTTTTDTASVELSGEASDEGSGGWLAGDSEQASGGSFVE